MAVRPDALRRQVTRLLARGWQPTTFSAGLTAPGGRQFAVTFDDGFLSTYERALPVLAELDVVATAFVPTALLTAGRPLSWDGFDPAPLSSSLELQPMTWAHARDLVARGWEVGSHSLTHPRLPSLTDAALRDELSRSRQECAERTGAPCRSIAYPFGAVDDRVQDAAHAAGYAWGASLGPHRSRRGPLSVPRTGIYREDDDRRFACKTWWPARSRPGLAVVQHARRVAARLPARRGGARC